jgi:hypothetical protein
VQEGSRVSQVDHVRGFANPSFRQYCTQMVGTYNGKFNKEGPAKGDKSYGGYANYNR